MNNEIKEILSLLKSSSWCNEANQIEDYITNLQEENEKLKEKVFNMMTMTACGDRKQIKSTAQYKLDIAQERIDKAIDHIKKHPITFDSNNDIIVGYFLDSTDADELLNILEGDDKK